MQTTYEAKRSRKVKKRKQRDTRRAVRQVLKGREEDEFSANFVAALINAHGLSTKCVPDIGQFLKNEARAKIWVICVKSEGTPRYKLIEGGIEDIENMENDMSANVSEITSVEERIEQIKLPDASFETSGFSRVAAQVTTFLETFATVLGNESTITRQQAKQVLVRVAGFSDTLTPNVPGKIIASLAKPTLKRPALLEHKGQNALDEHLITLSLAGQKVAKGAWALRDSPSGVRVFNFAVGAYVDNGELEREAKKQARKEERRRQEEGVAEVQEPFNSPRVIEAEQQLEQDPPQAPQAPLEPVESPLQVVKVQASGTVAPEPPAAHRPLRPWPQLEDAPPVPLPSTCGDFYLARASQRLFNVMVQECHPSDYRRVIDMLVAQVTGDTNHSAFRGVPIHF